MSNPLLPILEAYTGIPTDKVIITKKTVTFVDVVARKWHRLTTEYTLKNDPSVDGSFKGYTGTDVNHGSPGLIKTYRMSGKVYRNTLRVIRHSLDTYSIQVYSDQVAEMLQKADIKSTLSPSDIVALATQIYYIEENKAMAEEVVVFEVTTIADSLHINDNPKVTIISTKWWITPKKDLIGLPGTAKAAGEYVFVTGQSVLLTNDLANRDCDAIIMTGEAPSTPTDLDVVVSISYKTNTEDIKDAIVRANTSVLFEEEYNYFK